MNSTPQNESVPISGQSTYLKSHSKLKNRKTENRVSYDPAIPLLGIYPEKTNLKRYMHPYAHSSTTYNSQDLETT